MTWCVILYCYAGDRDGDRSLVGPFDSIGEARTAQRILSEYGDAEIRRVCSLEETQAALERVTVG